MLCAQHKSWKQYTVEHGLAGNDVFDIVQDDIGYLWFATDQGICRFNGYEFIRPVDTSAFAGNEAFVPTKDKNGRIWFARLDASIWFIERDSVKAYQYNDTIDLYRQKFGILDQLGIEDDGTLWLAFPGFGFLVIGPNGSHHIVKGSSRHNFLFTRVGNKMIFAFQVNSKQVKPGDTLDFLQMRDDQIIILTQSILKDYWNNLSGAWTMSNQEVICYFDDNFINFNFHNPPSIISTTIFPEKTVQFKNGNVLIASHSGKNNGLHFFKSYEHFKRQDATNLLPDYFVTDILQDKEGGWWAATRNAGVLYCKNPSIDIYDIESGFASSNILRLAYDGGQHIYVAVKPMEVWKINTIIESASRLPSLSIANEEMIDLFYDTIHQFLWNSTPLKYLENGKWKLFTHLSINKTQGLYVKEISGSPAGQFLWCSASLGFYKIEIPSYEYSFQRRSDNKTQIRTFSVTQDLQDNVWVATLSGLKLWKDGNYHPPTFSHEALRFPVRDTELLPDGSLAITPRGGGILIKTPEGALTQITVKEGLTTNFINKLVSTSKGELFACSQEGLSRLIKSNGKWEVININKKQGLPANLVNDVTVIGEEIWVATSNGLARIKERFPIHPVSAPLLEEFIVNDQLTTYKEGLTLPHDKNNINIKFLSIHFRSEGDIMYRYRLLPDTSFALTKIRQVNFPGLQHGHYSLEVQALNENAEWSKSEIWTFAIKPPWWKTAWFYGLLGLIVVTGSSQIINQRIKTIKKETAVSHKIKDLEKAALRAQMNPHFIFNCLGSIQQFIVENDKDSATRYLTRFAKLVRLSLHSSVDGHHTLSEEIEMLDNYLALEQMRFKEQFSYEIRAGQITDHNEITFPPMLIQPFVENAIIHGVRNLPYKGAIVVEFLLKGNMLNVLVTDNGRGITAEDQTPIKAHKSIGTSLTKRRLDLLTGPSTEHNFRLENIIEPDGRIAGTQTRIQIPVE